MSQMTGQQLIATERQRQIDVEGWSAEHDDQHGAENIERAARSYRDAAGEDSAQPDQWPWKSKWWKPKNRQRNLERAGALYQSASDVAERAGDYGLRDSLREQVAGCANLLNSIKGKQTYRIFHNYDLGDQSVYLSSLTDPSRAAAYCQFLAEEHLGDSATVLNIGIAKALIQFYDCTPTEKTDAAISIDLYYLREGLCGEEHKKLMADQALQREGIIDMIRPHTEI